MAGRTPSLRDSLTAGHRRQACVPTATLRAPACPGAGSPRSGRRPCGTRSPPSRSRRRRAPGAPPPGTGRRSSRTPQPAGARVVGTTNVSTGAGVAVSCRPLTLPHSNVCFPPPSGRPPSSTLQFRCESATRQAQRARGRRGSGGGGAPSPPACRSAGSRRRRRPPPPPRGCAGTARPGRCGRPASTPGATAGSVSPSVAPTGRSDPHPPPLAPAFQGPSPAALTASSRKRRMLASAASTPNPSRTGTATKTASPVWLVRRL